jgi:transcriptional regulator with XRE-family HTH domain
LDAKPDLRGLRERAGLSQDALAEKLGARQSAISNWESGRTALGDMARSFAEATGSSLEEVEAAAVLVRKPSSNSTALNLVLVFARSIDSGGFHGEGDPPVAAYSPRGPQEDPIRIDLPRSENWRAELEQSPLMQGILLGLGLAGAVELRVHNETGFTEQGGSPFTVRRQAKPKHQGRDMAELLLRGLLSRVDLKPGFFDEPMRAAARGRVLASAPGGSEGLVVVAALSGDTWGWLCSQLQPGVRHAAVFFDFDRDPFLTVIGVDGSGLIVSGNGSVDGADLGVTPGTTLHEVAEKILPL